MLFEHVLRGNVLIRKVQLSETPLAKLPSGLRPPSSEEVGAWTGPGTGASLIF